MRALQPFDETTFKQMLSSVWSLVWRQMISEEPRLEALVNELLWPRLP